MSLPATTGCSPYHLPLRGGTLPPWKLSARGSFDRPITATLATALGQANGFGQASTNVDQPRMEIVFLMDKIARYVGQITADMPVSADIGEKLRYLASRFRGDFESEASHMLQSQAAW